MQNASFFMHPGNFAKYMEALLGLKSMLSLSYRVKNLHMDTLKVCLLAYMYFFQVLFYVGYNLHPKGKCISIKDHPA